MAQVFSQNFQICGIGVQIIHGELKLGIFKKPLIAINVCIDNV